MNSGPGNPRRREFRKRDDRIKELLLTPEGLNPETAFAARELGMTLLDESLCELVFSYLRYLATRGQSGCSRALLTPAVLRDIWTDTMSSVWSQVEAGGFKSEGSLFSYVITIARRRTLDRIRAKLRHREFTHPDFDPMKVQDKMSTCDSVEFQDNLEAFLQSLDTLDRRLFETDVKLIAQRIAELEDQQARNLEAEAKGNVPEPAEADEKQSSRVTAEELLEELQWRYPEHPWTIAGVRRRRSRVRKRFLDFLQE